MTRYSKPKGAYWVVSPVPYTPSDPYEYLVFDCHIKGTADKTLDPAHASQFETKQEAKEAAKRWVLRRTANTSMPNVFLVSNDGQLLLTTKSQDEEEVRYFYLTTTGCEFSEGAYVSEKGENFERFEFASRSACRWGVRATFDIADIECDDEMLGCCALLRLEDDPDAPAKEGYTNHRLIFSFPVRKKKASTNE